MIVSILTKRHMCDCHVVKLQVHSPGRNTYPVNRPGMHKKSLQMSLLLYLLSIIFMLFSGALNEKKMFLAGRVAMFLAFSIFSASVGFFYYACLNPRRKRSTSSDVSSRYAESGEYTHVTYYPQPALTVFNVLIR